MTLGPLFRQDGFLQGWISVHYLDPPGSLGPGEVATRHKGNAALERCRLTASLR